ncbi:Ribosome recycling factor [gamma proteobacterium IMCC2047]|nr:Ribosome recycling factor [gamma proteobacterium IMCC2047]
MINEIKKDAEQRMEKALVALGAAFNRIRTGRAHASILDSVSVTYYGSETPLNQVANISVDDGRTLMISPWEKPMIPEVEKAILKSNLGLNPVTTGDIIRIPMPALTEETRKDLVKQAKAEAEQARVSVRSVRRDANSDIKELQKEKEISEDEERKASDEIQKITDKYIAKIEEAFTAKEADLKEI